MEYGIISRIDRKDALELSKKIIDYVSRHSDILVEANTAEHLELHNTVDSAPLEEMNVKTMITVGGDGTILKALQNVDAAIFAVNMGRVGFLTEVPKDDVEKFLERFMNGDYIIEQRSKLRTIKNNTELVDAVNEAVLHTSQIAKMRHFDIFVDDVKADDIRADGLIIATPTGSTCYAMSAGSPIIDPRVPAHVIVPIAPYKLSTRPLVVPANSEIRIEEAEKRESILVIDGQYEEILEDDVLYFTRSTKTARFIRFNGNFYHRVREKLLR